MDITKEFNKAAATAEFECSAYTTEQIIDSDKPEIIFSGKSNVGKSSIINRLLNRKALARVSSAPGKTASVNFYNCGVFRLVDLPGYGFARVSFEEKKKWSHLVEGYFNTDRQMKLVVQLVDSRHPASDNDLDMINYLMKCQIPFIIVMTKSDKLKKTQLDKRIAESAKELGFSGAKIIFTSAETSLGFDELKREIFKSFD